MQFLAPIFLTALAALAIPLYLHFRRDRPSETIPFSAVMFLNPTAIPPVRRRTLRDILLLILRCLALALLALIFARPFFAKTEETLSTESAATLILLDTSASMQGAPMAEAKRQITEILTKEADTGPIAFATFSRSLTTHNSFESYSQNPTAARSSIATAFKETETDFFPTNLGLALTSAADLLTLNQHTSNLPSKLYVISDFQNGSETTDLTDFSWPAQVQFIPIKTRAKKWTNASIRTLDEKQIVIQNSASSQEIDFTLRWPDSQKPKESIPIKIAPGQSQTLPQQAQTATLSGDDFPFDNTTYFPPAQSQNLLIKYLGNANPEDSQDTLFFLNRAFPENPKYQTTLDILPIEQNALSSNPLPALIFLDGTPFTPANQALAKNTLESGGIALLTLRKPEDSRWIPFLTDSRKTPKTTEAEVADYSLFGEIAYNSPLLLPFADPRFGDFSRIHIWKHRTLDLTDLPTASTLISFDSGEPALIRLPTTGGQLYVLTTSWAPADSQLALSSKFVPLLHSLVEQSPLLATGLKNLKTGDSVTLPPGIPRKIITPSGKTATADTSGHFTATDQPGFYQTSDNRLKFAVNLHPEESQLTPLSDFELKSLGLPLQSEAKTSTATETRQIALREQEKNQKLWWWLALAALLALSAETIFAAITGRRKNIPASA